jgi:ABC-type glycerol-3-phosphate transport system substrate-binding protein
MQTQWLFRPVLAALLLASFPAQAEWNWTEAAKPYKGSTIHVRVPVHPSTRATAPLVKEFEQATGINVEYSNQTVSRDLLAKQDIELATGVAAYDVMFISGDTAARVARAGWAEPLDPYIANSKLTDPAFNRADFIPTYLSILSPKGTLIGLPYTGESTILYYRTDILEKAGFKKPPETMDELEAVAQKIHSSEVPAWGVRARRGQGLNIFIWSQWLWSYGGRYFDDSMHPVLNSPEAIRATEKYAELLRKYGPKGFEDITHHDIVYNQFTQGKLGMFIDASVWNSVLDDPSKSTVVGKWSTAVVPSGPAGRFPAVNAQGMMIPKVAKNKEAAWLFVQWFTSRETQWKRAVQVTGEKSGDVTRQSVYADTEYRKLYGGQNWIESTFEDARIARIDYRPFQLPEWVQIGDLLGIAVQDVISGKSNAKDALGEANKKITDLMKKAGYF